MSDPDAPITLDQLRVFLTVVEEGSFSRAAKRLRRVQSAVSYSIANLERLLEVPLFDRTGRKPTLTDAGRALLPETRAAVDRIDQLTARARQLASGLEPTLSLAVDVLFPMPVLLEVLSELTERYGELDLSLRTEALGAVVELVAEGVCQIGVGVDLGEPPRGVVTEPLTEVEMVPVCAPGHALLDHAPPLGPAPLERAIQIVVSDRSRRTAGVDHGVDSARTWRVASLESKLALLVDGYGWGRLPDHLAAPEIAAGRLEALDLGRAHPRVPLVTLHRLADPPGIAGRWLLDALHARLTDRTRAAPADTDR